MFVSEQSKCPETHPFVYANGIYCCANNQEKVYFPLGDKCNGGPLSKDSLCCKEDAYVKCANAKCVSSGTYYN